jgi:hypothetical protein
VAAQSPLEHLARVLAKNYFDTSQTLFDTGPGGILHSAAAAKLARTGRQVFADPDGEDLAVQRPERTVLIVGAGASFGAFGNAYPGTEAAVQRISRALGLSPADHTATPSGKSQGAEPSSGRQFEAALGALVEEFGDARIRQELVTMYGERYHPHLGFEIIAHLFKHRFIDVIINFNFDELLDEAIEGEMGTAEYQHVLFEGECQGLAPLLVDRRLKIPLYIKPNGTVSHPSSMRFTREPRARLPEPMHGLLTQIIGGHWVDDPGLRNLPTYRPYHVNLITVGFSLENPQFLEILQEVGREERNSGITLFHLNQGEGLRALEAAAQTRELPRAREEFIDVDKVEAEKESESEERKKGLAEAIRALWNAVSARFQKPFRPRGIARHEIVHNLFFAGGPDGAAGTRVPARAHGRSPNLDYFRARLYAEVAMAIARGNGQIDLGTMSESRVGAMFDLMRGCPDGRNISMHQILEPFSHGGKVEFSGRDNSVFRFQYESAANAEQLNENMARALWTCLFHALKSINDPEYQLHLNDMWNNRRADKMVARFARLASSDAQDISPTFRHRHLLLSRQPEPNDVIHTSLGLTLRFVEMLDDPWDLMLAVSENGKVMDKYRRHLGKNFEHDVATKKFCLLLARNDHPEIAEARLKRYFPQMLGVGDPPILYIPAWAHNQHMVLLLRRIAGEYRPVSAVRYETPRLGTRVNPVFIRNSRADLEAALECFKRYAHMSVRGVRNGYVNTDVEDAVLRREGDALWAWLIAEKSERSEAAARWMELTGRSLERPSPPAPAERTYTDPMLF